MRRKLLKSLIYLLLVSIPITLGKCNSTNKIKVLHKKQINLKPHVEGERIKRALNNEYDRPFWASRGKKSIHDNLPDEKEANNKIIKELHKFNDNDQPFWAIRGKRDSLSTEDYAEYTENSKEKPKLVCKDCLTPLPSAARNLQNFMESYSPFWGNRGRRDSDEVTDGYTYEPFWGARGRRQNEFPLSGNPGNKKEDVPVWGNKGLVADEPFWGNRGRRDDEPFWGNRGRRAHEPFWGNRGRRDDEPFWGNRGRRDHEQFWGNRGRRDVEPFWGNRGRRQDSEPFWGSRGRRQDSESFWGNRGRREDSDPFWGNRGRRENIDYFWPSRGRRKGVLKESILNELSDVENDIEKLSRLKRNNRIIGLNSFWENRGRDSKIKYLFNGSFRNSRPFIMNLSDTRLKTSDPGTVHDSRIYVDQPHYILTERNSRSSAEDDPYIISRGKKYHIDYNMFKEARDRRGAIEEIVKSVRNDPYYIVRGKKTTNVAKPANVNNEFSKAKELVCAAIDLITIKNQGEIVKREMNDNDHDGRTILKKLAAQLQIDPYYVSRGKKNVESVLNEDLTNFINDLAEKCN